MTGRKDLLDLAALTRDEIEYLLETAKPFKGLISKSVKKVPTLRGKTVLNLFYEPSTRTRSSFEIAAKRLSADVTNFTVSTSSVVKGESILDTIDTLQAMRIDYIVIRHQMSGVPNLVAKHTGASVLNAGDGYHAHPTQGLLDAYTLREVFPESAGKKVVICGDILHSRVARSTSTILSKMDVEVGLFGPGTLIPPSCSGRFKVFRTFEEVMDWGADVVYLLRVQLERQKAQFFPSLHEYHRQYGVTDERFEEIKKRGIWVMHPGPINRGVELIDDVTRYERCLINQQVENGIPTRMAAMYWLKPETSN
ncbi:MAG: aspartate carbamoyltransferase catalytic subunit [Verrucomicrobiales bacterium]|nr:aspartate carbamoyltransferase catalytic subunit [Verrucomicrobiales bacterium]